MARITVEDCLAKERNRFSLVRLASVRAKQLLNGKTPVSDARGNKPVVVALREIADGKVRFRRDESLLTSSVIAPSAVGKSGSSVADGVVGGVDGVGGFERFVGGNGTH